VHITNPLERHFMLPSVTKNRIWNMLGPLKRSLTSSLAQY